MRTYIFTKRERRLIEGFFRGEIPRVDPGLSQLVHRVSLFNTRLSEDIYLLNRFREAVAAASA